MLRSKGITKVKSVTNKTFRMATKAVSRSKEKYVRNMTFMKKKITTVMILHVVKEHGLFM